MGIFFLIFEESWVSICMTVYIKYDQQFHSQIHEICSYFPCEFKSSLLLESWWSSLPFVSMRFATFCSYYFLLVFVRVCFLIKDFGYCVHKQLAINSLRCIIIIEFNPWNLASLENWRWKKSHNWFKFVPFTIQPQHQVCPFFLVLVWWINCSLSRWVKEILGFSLWPSRPMRHESISI